MSLLHVTDVVAPEREKYDEMWNEPEYSKVVPGVQFIPHFMEVIKPVPGETIVDVGCGSGAAGLEFGELGLDPWWTDLTDAALLPGVARDRFAKGPVWNFLWTRMRPASGWDYGYCVDVLEHIPREYTMLAAERIIRACHISWLTICNLPDVHGIQIGKQLHMTVEPVDWWLDRLTTLGQVIDVRDLSGRCMFMVRR